MQHADDPDGGDGGCFLHPVRQGKESDARYFAVREMGFGAGMGLPNMKKNVDELTIESKVGEGTVVRMLTYFSANDR